MASPILAMIGAITLGMMGVIALTSLVVISVQIGLALGRVRWRSLFRR
jgi:hypothetical protein